MKKKQQVNKKDIDAVQAGLRELREADSRLKRDMTGLLSKYPDCWVAVGSRGLITVSDSMHDAFNIALRKLGHSDFRVAYLTPVKEKVLNA